MRARWPVRLRALLPAERWGVTLAAVAAWLLLGLTLQQHLVGLSRTLARRERDLWFFFSSDTLGLALMFTDLFRDGLHWWGWNISSAPEYPEMAWYFLLCALSGSTLAGHVLSALLQPVLLALALTYLFRALGGAHARAAHLAAPWLVVVIVLLINRHWALDFGSWMWSLRHASTVIVALFALGGFARVIAAPRPAAWWVLTLASALGCASDMLFLPMFVLPACATVLCLGLARQLPLQRASALLATLVAATVAGLFVFRIATPARTVAGKMAPAPDRALEALARLAADLVASRLRIVFTLVMLAAVVLAAVAVVRGLRRGRTPQPLALVGGVMLLMIAMTLGAVVLTAKPLDESGYTRYLLPVQTATFAACGLALWSGLTRMTRGSTPWTAGLLIAAVAVPLFVRWRPLPPETPLAWDHYPPLSRCLDDVAQKHGLHYGIADYWLAKSTTALSRRDLRVYPVSWSGDAAPVYANVEWFLGGVGAHRHDAPHYTFAILGSLAPDHGGLTREIAAEWGPPRAVERCLGYEVLVLGETADAAIKARFRRHPMLRAYYPRHGYALP